jgi:phosphatidyl-myo-inositol dimannoside synthase
MGATSARAEVTGRRILHVTSNYPRWPGDSTTPFVHDLAVGLVERGWDITVVAPHFPGAARDEVMDGVRVHRFTYLLPRSAQTLCYGGGALANLRSSRTAKFKLPALVTAEWASLVGRLRRRTDLVHAHWVLPQGFVATTQPSRVPRLLTAHGSDVMALRGRVLDAFSRFAVRHVDGVTVGSTATREAVASLGAAADKISMIPFGVDLQRRADHDVVRRLRGTLIPTDGPLLVFLGRLVEEKGVLDAIEAMAMVQPSLPTLRMAVVGAGQDEGRARRLARQLGIEHCTLFAGWAEPAEVPSWLAAADIVLAPSWREGQGIVLLEAMAQARPVVATRTGGITDAIDDGVTGRLVEPGRPDQLAAAIRDLVADPDGARAMGNLAAQVVTARYDWCQTLDGFDDLYRRLIRDHR